MVNNKQMVQPYLLLENIALLVVFVFGGLFFYLLEITQIIIMRSWNQPKYFIIFWEYELLLLLV